VGAVISVEDKDLEEKEKDELIDMIEDHIEQLRALLEAAGVDFSEYGME